MNRAARSLAWGGIAFVTLGMALVVTAVVTGEGAPVPAPALVVDPTPDGTMATFAPSASNDGTGDTQAGDESTGSPGTGPPPTGSSTSAQGTSDPTLPDVPGMLSPDASDSSSRSSETTAGATLTTAVARSLEERFLATAPSAGFVVFTLDEPGWRMTALDAGGQGASAYLTVAWENGEDYVNLSQSPSGARPSLANASPIEFRGLEGEIYQMAPVLLLRWDEQDTGLLFSTDLPRREGLALVERLQPLR